ncbi:hypothetical protein [Thiosulfatimonas sediminis]|nr:hypothetical protein [Thiosulfatimonas sediminis]
MLENQIVNTLKAKRRQKLASQKGASMMEYALIIAGIAVVAAILFGTGGEGDTGGVVGEAITNKVNQAVGNTTE